MAIFKHVLVGTDFSEASSGALDVAIELAGALDAQLTVIHSGELPVTPDMGAPIDLVTPVLDAARERLDEAMAGIRARFPGARSSLRVGCPWEQLLAAAAEVGADVIVLGTHGRRGVAHALMGSVAERVIRLSPVPVLTVRGSGRR